MIIEEKLSILQWEDHSAIAVFIDPNFPVKVTEIVMYSFQDYVAVIGGQYSVLATIIAVFAQLLLYPVMVKELGNELKNQEFKEAENLNTELLEQENIDEE